MLGAATAVFSPRRLRAISAIESTVCTWPGMRAGIHRLGGIGFFCHGKESSHIHGNGLLDCFVGWAERDRLVASGEALPHHMFPNSGWISFWIDGENDVETALRLIRIAARE
jgi:hypothetical protein